ncbi:MAG: enoyl-CoA hydratase/isomerase family protein [Rhodoferax sp.]|nr:enoyl-CoA hydratase/isomerase family protein [Rhodoferax sp.]
MSGSVVLETSGSLAHVTLEHPEKLNAMSRAMWHGLRQVFEQLQPDPSLTCVVLSGRTHFCAGGDIAEYTSFRFEPDSLRNFHENEVWPALQAILDCDIPIVAQIAGYCMGAGIEIASCCDIRVAADNARFGAPIAKLGFPMAPREAALIATSLGALTAREMLLCAAQFDAHEMQRRGFLNQVVPASELDTATTAYIDRILPLAPQAARLNKQTLRALGCENFIEKSYQYASSHEHREGITAFLEKRAPRFHP